MSPNHEDNYNMHDLPSPLSIRKGSHTAGIGYSNGTANINTNDVPRDKLINLVMHRSGTANLVRNSRYKGIHPSLIHRAYPKQQEKDELINKLFRNTGADYNNKSRRLSQDSDTSEKMKRREFVKMSCSQELNKSDIDENNNEDCKNNNAMDIKND